MFWGLTKTPLAGAGTEEVAAVAFRGGGARRQRGEVGDQHEEGERNLGTLSVGLGVAGAGAPAAHRERRRRRSGGLGVVEGSGSFTAARRS